MTLPPWFCSVICAGLNVDDLVSGEETIEEPSDFQENQNTSNLFKTEEEFHLNRGRVGSDPSTTRPPAVGVSNYKNYKGM